jgi:hypothetical protein
MGYSCCWYGETAGNSDADIKRPDSWINSENSIHSTSGCATFHLLGKFSRHAGFSLSLRSCIQSPSENKVKRWNGSQCVLLTFSSFHGSSNAWLFPNSTAFRILNPTKLFGCLATVLCECASLQCQSVHESWPDFLPKGRSNIPTGTMGARTKSSTLHRNANRVRLRNWGEKEN